MVIAASVKHRETQLSNVKPFTVWLSKYVGTVGPPSVKSPRETYGCKYSCLLYLKPTYPSCMENQVACY